MKKRFIAIAAVICIVCAVLSGCASEKKARFTQIDPGMSSEEILTTFGYDCTVADRPDRIIYYNLRLLESLPGGRTTKLTFFLDGEKSYAAAFYVYDDPDSDFEKAAKEFDKAFGESEPGENENTLIWHKGEGSVSLTKAADYIVAGMY